MQRPFAVIGFSVFFTSMFLFRSETGAIRAVLICSAAALVVALFVGKLRKAKVVPMSLSAVALTCIMLLVQTECFYVPLTEYDGRICKIKARLTDNGENEYGNYYFGAETVEIDGKETEIDVRLTFENRPDVEAYDCVEGDFVFYLRGKSRGSALLSNKASGSILGAYPASDFSVIGVSESEKPIAYKLILYREAIINAVYKVLPDERGALAVAMLLGNKSDVPSDVYRNIRTVGLAHTVCVSGLHLSLWTGLLINLFEKMRLNRKVGALLSAVGVVAFTALAGFTYSVVRACIMMLIYLFAEIISRKNDSLNSLGAAITVMACINPFSLGSLALELSVLSTAGVIIDSQFIYPEISDFLYRKISNKSLRGAMRKVISSFSPTVCVSIMTVPLVYNFTASISLYPLVSNIIVLPFVGISMVLCVLAALWGIPFGTSGNVFAFAGGFINQKIIDYSEAFSEFDILNLRMEQESVTLILCGVMLFIIIALLLGMKGKGKPALAAFLAFAILVSSSIYVSYSERIKTRIEVIDTGDGMSALFTLNGENVLVNCGGDSFFAESRIMNAIDTCYGKIDCVVLSECDEQTSSEAVGIISEYSPDTLMCGKAERETLQVSGGAVQIDINGTYCSENFIIKGYDGYIAVETKDAVSVVCADASADLPQADILITHGNGSDKIPPDKYGFVAVCGANLMGVRLQNQLVSKGVNSAATADNGNLVVSVGNGDISVKRKDG